MSPRISHSPPTLPPPRETSQHHSTTKKHHNPTKRTSNQDPKKEDITTLERITSTAVPESHIVPHSCIISEQEDGSRKASKQASLTNAMSSKSPTKSSQPHQSKSTTLHGKPSKPDNCQPQHHHKTSAKESSPTKKRHSKHNIMGTALGSQQAKFDGATSKIGDTRDLPLSEVAHHTISCFAEEARSSNIVGMVSQ